MDELLSLYTPEEIKKRISHRLRTIRLKKDMKQETLALRAGISLSSLRRFEQKAEASFDLVVRVAFALSVAGELEGLFEAQHPGSIEEVLQMDVKNRGRR